MFIFDYYDDLGEIESLIQSEMIVLAQCCYDCLSDDNLTDFECWATAYNMFWFLLTNRKLKPSTLSDALYHISALNCDKVNRNLELVDGNFIYKG